MDKLKQTKTYFKNLSKMKKVYFMQQKESLEHFRTILENHCKKKIRFYININ